MSLTPGGGRRARRPALQGGRGLARHPPETWLGSFRDLSRDESTGGGEDLVPGGLPLNHLF